MYNSREVHFREWVRIAGRRNIEVARTPTTNKLHLTCKVCCEELTAKEPEDVTSIDHSVQEWVRMHGHSGYSPQWAMDVKADAGGVVYPSTLDKSPAKAAAINQTIKNYQQEVAAKMDDAVLAKKIADLQAVTPEQKAEAAQFFKEKEAFAQQAINAAAEFILKEQFNKQSKFAEQAKQGLLNELQLKKALLQAELAALEGKVDAAKPKPDAALQTKSGRKFR